MADSAVGGTSAGNDSVESGADGAGSTADIRRRDVHGTHRAARQDPSAESDESGSKPPRRRSGLLFVRDVLVILLIAILVSFLIKTFLIRSFYIPSESMRNTLQVDDRIIVNQLSPDLIPLSHGDVVVFKDPGGWLSSSAPVDQPPLLAATDWLLSLVGLSSNDTNDHLIKRVIGLPGDRVECCNALGQMSINGIPIKEPYVLLPDGQTRVSAKDFAVTVPDGYLWVMGDNRYNSEDSRYNQDKPGKGFVPIENVVGRAFVISWPVARWAWLDDYPEVFRDIEPTEGLAPPVARQTADGS